MESIPNFEVEARSSAHNAPPPFFVEVKDDWQGYISGSRRKAKALQHGVLSCCRSPTFDRYAQLNAKDFNEGCHCSASGRLSSSSTSRTQRCPQHKTHISAQRAAITLVPCMESQIWSWSLKLHLHLVEWESIRGRDEQADSLVKHLRYHLAGSIFSTVHLNRIGNYSSSQ